MTMTELREAFADWPPPKGEIDARLGKSKRSIYRLIAAGVSIEDVAGLLGNTTTVALRAYVDLTAQSERLREAAKRG